MGQLAAHLSKTEIDRLGDRLRQGFPTEPDLTLLHEYRRSFGDAYDTVVRTVREHLQLEPTGRPAKTIGSIVDKLRRETIRLSQVQDIAGCRVIVDGLAEQDRVVDLLRATFPRVSVVDRRVNPSYGYRAVHVIVQIAGKLIEIQVRSSMQHAWAELSEKFSDRVDPAIKYGGGPQGLQQALASASDSVATIEEQERHVAQRQELRLDKEQQRLLVEDLGHLGAIKGKLAKLFRDAIAQLETQRGQEQ